MIAQEIFSPELLLADWTATVNRSLLRQMIAVVSKAGILSFAGGLPDPELFPAADMAEAFNLVLTTDPKALQYGPPYEPLKQHIVMLMAERGVHCTKEQIFLTTGAQQGLDILTRLLLNPGGEVMLEEIVYTGAQQVVFPHQPHIIGIGTDLETGLDVGEVTAHLALGARPAYIYVIPQAHNPLGVTLSFEKRKQLVDLAARYGVPIIEDDPYGFLNYSGKQCPPLYTLNNEWVFYLGSFSKILAPALRLGWMIVPEYLIPRLTVVKEAGDLESSALTQRAVAAFLNSGKFPDHLHRLCDAYGRRRTAMLKALEQYFPSDTFWTEPSGGMFIWVELPDHIDSVELLEQSISLEKVAFIPGHAFAIPDHPEVNRRAQHSFRLSFSNCSTDQIEDGIRRLANLIKHF